MLAVRLPVDVEDRLDVLAKVTKRTKSFYAREAIIEHLNELEDLYITEQRWIDHIKGKKKSIPIEEVMKRYEMEN